MNAIDVQQVTKRFGQVQALNGVDLTVQQGEVFTLLGKNGAGKTTLIDILTTLSQPDSGQVTIAGLDSRHNDAAIREKIALNAQSTTLDANITGYANLKLIAQLRGIKQVSVAIHGLAKQLDLTDFLDRKVATYSGGMKRRLDLALSLLGDPEIIFLDEPTTGVDPQSRLELWQIIDELRQSGKTIFLTTQYLEEADKLSDHIAFLNQGRIVKYGTPAQLKQDIHERFVIQIHASQLKRATTILDAATMPYQLEEAAIKVNKTDKNTALRILLDRGIEVQAFNQEVQQLESVFLNETK